MNAASASRQDAEAARQTEQIVDFLRRPDSYPQRTTAVECVETHISWVMLTDRFAYKLKKPVRFDFLDFSTPSQRRAACEDELQLNRRLAPDVYLELTPVTRDDRGRLAVGGAGKEIDWLVKMRRLHAGAALDRLLAEGRLAEPQVERLARWLVASYEQLPPVTIRSDDYRRGIEQHVAANERALLDPAAELPAARVRRVHAAQRRLLRLAPEVLDDRVCDGRIVEGHGDLRPEHVYLTPAPVAIDCVEFNREFRVIDVIDDLGFLAMECDFLGAPEIGSRVLQRYREASGDDPPRELMQFYQSYRACVRAKVLALRSRQQEDGGDSLAEARRYLQLAEADVTRFCQPLLIVVRGLPGAGKSTLASSLAELLGCRWLQSDEVRVELFGPPRGGDGFNRGRYSEENRQAVYAELLRRAEAALQEGRSAVLDGTFLAADLRTQAAAAARRQDAAPLLVRCRCDPELAQRRIQERNGAASALSEAQAEFFQLQAAQEQPDPPGLASLPVDTGAGQQAAVDVVVRRLREMLFAGV